MKHDCSNCFYGGPGDPFECWDCWNGSRWVDICGASAEIKEDNNEMERQTASDGSD